MRFRRLPVLLALAGLLFAGPRLEAAKKKEAQIIPEKQRQCRETTASGLGWRALRPGAGVSPQTDDMVRIDYIGYFAKSGAVFDENADIWLSLKGVVPGFAEGLKLMKTGGIHRLCVPWRLGYGSEGGGPIPGRSDLVFQIVLLDVQSREAYQAMVKAAKTRKKK